MMLKGEKVVLREKRLEDASNDYAWRADPELARLDAASPLSISFPEYLVGCSEELRYPTPWQERFAVDTLDGKHIGNIMFFDIDDRRKQAEMGIIIGDRAYWDKGYGTDAINTLLKYIFSTTPIERVYLHTLDWNLRAQAGFAKCGFKEAGRTRRDGFRFVVMEVYKEEFEGCERKPHEREKAETKRKGGA